jgi:hypothetical protein
VAVAGLPAGRLQYPVPGRYSAYNYTDKQEGGFGNQFVDEFVNEFVHKKNMYTRLASDYAS